MQYISIQNICVDLRVGVSLLNAYLITRKALKSARPSSASTSTANSTLVSVLAAAGGLSPTIPLYLQQGHTQLLRAASNTFPLSLLLYPPLHPDHDSVDSINKLLLPKQTAKHNKNIKDGMVFVHI